MGSWRKSCSLATRSEAATPLVHFLEKQGHKVIAVPNGKEALAQVLADLPDLVILDLMMPEMVGPSFLEVVRSYLRLQSLLCGADRFVRQPHDRTGPLAPGQLDSGQGNGELRRIKHAVDEALVRLPG